MKYFLRIYLTNPSIRLQFTIMKYLLNTIQSIKTPTGQTFLADVSYSLGFQAWQTPLGECQVSFHHPPPKAGPAKATLSSSRFVLLNVVPGLAFMFFETIE